ncbi:MAG: hypothetical protein P4L33_18860 [Capsulimonadaceae bacterium]|nr:hypothetical protein [Capsulimonadaceae bacterium]
MPNNKCAVVVSILALVLAIISSSSLQAEPAATELLTNPGFEAPYVAVSPGTGKARITGSVAKGWTDNSSWADVTVNYAREADDVHGGSSAQRVTVEDVRGGRVQLAQSIPVISGHIYKLSLWLKGRRAVQAGIALRQGPAPYETYGEQSVVLTGAWQNVTVLASAKATTEGEFMIYPPTGASMLIDDASAEDVTTAVSDAPPRTGNLLPDGSFEAGFGGGWSVRVEYGDASTTAAHELADPRAEIDKTTAADQKQSVKVVLPCAGRAEFSSARTPFNYGRPHTVSLWMKSDVPGAEASFKLEGLPAVKYVRLTPVWQRFSLTMVVPYSSGAQLLVSEEVPKAGTVWIDGAELVEGTSPSANTPSAVELALRVDRPGGIFYDGEPAVINLAMANAPAGSTVRATCTDLYGHTQTLPAVPASAPELRLQPDPTHPRGMFKVTAQVYDSAGMRIGPAVQQVFARLSRPRTIEPEQSYFGVHIPLATEYFQIARAIGARWCRIHDASWVTIWPVVEHNRGEYTFTDDGVDAAKKNGVAILGMLDGGPAWASIKPRATRGYFASYNIVDAPGAEDAWKAYVNKVVTHYKGKIDAWEVWNEPWGGDFKPGAPEFYGQLLKDAYPIVKRANPRSVVVGIDTYRGGDTFTDGAFKASGGSSSYDEFSYHDYYESLYGGPKSPSVLDRAIYDSYENKYGKITPRWITESAPEEGVQSLYWPAGKEQDTRIQYAKTVRFDVAVIAAGVKHVFYYSLHADPRYGETCLFGLEHDRTIRPIMAARAVLASLIDGGLCTGRTEPVTGVDCYGFDRAGKSAVDVLWSYDGNDHIVPIHKGARVLDALGNPLAAHGGVNVGMEPVYVVK